MTGTSVSNNLGPVHTKTIVNANDSKRIFFSPSTRRRSSFTWRFQIYPLWSAFSNLCVYGERFHRLRVDGRPKRIKKFAFTIVCVYNRLRVDGALEKRKFNSLWIIYVVWYVSNKRTIQIASMNSSRLLCSWLKASGRGCWNSYYQITAHVSKWYCCWKESTWENHSH